MNNTERKHRQNLDSIHKLIQDARKRMLKHEPGTRAQEQAWVTLKHLIVLRDQGQAWIPKF